MKLALFAAAAILASLVLLRRAALVRFFSLTGGLCGFSASWRGRS